MRPSSAAGCWFSMNARIITFKTAKTSQPMHKTFKSAALQIRFSSTQIWLKANQISQTIEVGVIKIKNAPNLIRLMEEQKRPTSQSQLQLTLDHSLRHEQNESSYDHLVAHLVEDEQAIRDTNEWTRVFTRDGSRGRQIAIFTLGPDLLYDKSVRESLSDLEVSSGEVLFSPL